METAERLALMVEMVDWEVKAGNVEAVHRVAGRVMGKGVEADSAGEAGREAVVDGALGVGKETAEVTVATAEAAVGKEVASIVPCKTAGPRALDTQLHFDACSQ
mmetsp:Transcript_8401/g.15939  ORF Transcript_8401/g.15939 Transcript_8401/m.15939 type:complete len:104 (-) Transcript_8401:210-521(-)